MESHALCTLMKHMFIGILPARLSSCSRRTTNTISAVDHWRQNPLCFSLRIPACSHEVTSLLAMILGRSRQHTPRERCPWGCHTRSSSASSRSGESPSKTGSGNRIGILSMWAAPNGVGAVLIEVEICGASIPQGVYPCAIAVSCSILAFFLLNQPPVPYQPPISPNPM